MERMSHQKRARRLGSFALSAVTAFSLMFPSTAFAQVSVDGQNLAQGDNAVGGGTATFLDQSLSMVNVVANNMYTDESLTVNFNGGNDIEDFTVGGSATVEVNYAGENEVEDTHAVDNANLTVNANGHNEFEEIDAANNASVTVNVTGENDFESIEAEDNANVTVRGTTCQRRDIANVGVDEDDAGVSAKKGNVVIDHVTINLVSEKALVGSESGRLVVDTSKIASDDDNEYAEIVAGDTMRIYESVIDIVGTVHSDGFMTIEHSDIEAQEPDDEYDKSPYRIYSKKGIELIRERNGEVKEGELDGDMVWYVDTGDGEDVDLEADGEPGYYKCKDKEALPKTSDASGVQLAATVALGGIALMALRRKTNN